MSESPQGEVIPDEVFIEDVLGRDGRTRGSVGMRQALLDKWAYNPTLFFSEALPLWFTLGFAPMHLGLVAILTQNVAWLSAHPDRLEVIRLYPRVFSLVDDKVVMVRHHKTAIMIPRGMAKTTIVRACLMWSVLMGRSHVAVICGMNAESAAASLLTIRAEFEENQRINAIFGKQAPRQRASTKKWSEEMLNLMNGATIIAKGTGSSFRGININSRRPDFIVCDDIESQESTNTQTQREKTSVWAMGDLEPSLVGLESEHYGRLVVIGTLLHPEQQLVKWQKDPAWLSIRFGAFDDTGAWLWREKMGPKEYAERRASYESQGLLYLFEREYNSKAIAKDASMFHLDDIQDVRKLPEIQHMVLAVDPAISMNKRADYTALVVVGVGEKGFYIVESQCKRMDMFETCNVMFDICSRHPINRVGIEAIAYQRALLELFQHQMMERKHFITVDPIQHGNVAKTERIEGLLQPIFKNKQMFFVQNGEVDDEAHPMLKEQMLSWPGGAHDDAADALSIAMKMVATNRRVALKPLQGTRFTHFSEIRPGRLPHYH